MQIAHPYEIDGRGRTAGRNVRQHVRDLIEQLLFTSPGERVNRPELGTGIQQLVFAPNGSVLADTTQLLVQGALQQWLSDWIAVERVSVIAEEATLTVTVAYLIRETGEPVTDVFEKSA